MEWTNKQIKKIEDKRKKNHSPIPKRSTVFGRSLLLSLLEYTPPLPLSLLIPPFWSLPSSMVYLQLVPTALLTHEILGWIFCCGQQWHLEWQGRPQQLLPWFLKIFSVIVCLNMCLFIHLFFFFFFSLPSGVFTPLLSLHKSLKTPSPRPPPFLQQ